MTSTSDIITVNQGLIEAFTANATVTIGRSSQNDIQVLDPKVSRFHCRIEQSLQGITLVDLNSKNGSFINGKRCTKAFLSNGDTLKLGDNTLSLPTHPNLTTPSIKRGERTMATKALPVIPPPIESTQEINPRGGNKELFNADMFKNNAEDIGAVMKSKASFFYGSIKNSKLYISATIIAFVAILLILFPLFKPYLSSSISEDIVTKEHSTSNATTPPQPPQPSAKKQEEATRIAREANTVLEAGDFNHALSLFNKALNLDPDNILAQEGVNTCNKHIEQLAHICFTKGVQKLQSFDYLRALKEFETVVLLLKNHPDHKLFIDATKNIAQAQLKVTK